MNFQKCSRKKLGEKVKQALKVVCFQRVKLFLMAHHAEISVRNT